MAFGPTVTDLVLSDMVDAIIIPMSKASARNETTLGVIVNYVGKTVSILVSDPGGSAITTGEGKAYFRVPVTLNGYNLTSVAASVDTVSSSGIPTIGIRRKRAGSDVEMLSTLLTIDASETDSSTAAAAAVIDTSNDDVATADRIYIDIDVAGTGAKGLLVEMNFQKP